jgi:vacuolar protein sorting-associated protein 13A/C
MAVHQAFNPSAVDMNN